MCTVLMENSSQVLIKKKKKKRISLVTLSPLIYVSIHHKLGKLVSYHMRAVSETRSNLRMKIPRLHVN